MKLPVTIIGSLLITERLPRQQMPIHSLQYFLERKKLLMRSVPHPLQPTNPRSNDKPQGKRISGRRLRSRQSQNAVRLIFWIFPPHIECFDNSFESRVIRLEHALIRAQSVAGYFATLGGGFYMCHHWSTVVQLARNQQKLAEFLGDKEMYYKCLLNQAYNFIYGGKFSTARSIIRMVFLDAASETNRDDALLNMCRSAWLFCRRVKKAKLRRRIDEPGTIDDYSRIRLVDDKSATTDLKRTRELLS